MIMQATRYVYVEHSIAHKWIFKLKYILWYDITIIKFQLIIN